MFSLAAITFELLTGRRPAGLGDEIGTLTAGTPNTWMDALHAVLARAMDDDPAARYPTALAFAAALEAAGRGELRRAASTRLRLAQGSGRRRRSSRGLRRRRLPTAPTRGPPTRRPARPADRARPTTSTPSATKTRREEQLRAEEAAAAPGAAMFTDLDGDIAAEAEADRFVADDFLLDAAGAASGVPEPPSMDTRRARTTLGIDPPIDPRALEDDEVMVDDAPSPVFEPRDLLHETKAERPRGVRRSRAVARIHASRRGRSRAGDARPGRWRCW